MLDKDLLNNASSKDVAKTCYGMVDALQGRPAHEQAAAAAVLFLTVCRTLRADPAEVFTAASNMLADSIHGENPSFRALRLYVQHEIGTST